MILCGWAAAALLPLPLCAAGFAIKEQSASSQGHAFASASTGIEDISTMFFNPSLLTFHQGSQTATVGSAIIPSSRFRNGSAAFSPAVGGGPITPAPGFTSLDDIGRTGFVPAGYAMISPHPDLRLALAVTQPFGLRTSNAEDWIGRYHALDTRLTTVNIAPTAAYRFNDFLSVGAGVMVQYADTSLSNAIDFGTIGFGLGGTPGAEDGRAKLKADDWGFGFTLGATLVPWEGTRIGFGYRSKVDHELSGNANFDRGTGIGQSVSDATGAFVDGGAETDIDLPEQVSIGLHQDLGERLAIMAEAQWTHWSRIDELRVEFDNPAQADDVTRQSWDNAWFLALGGSYRPHDDWTVKLGFAFDQSPVPERTRTPRLPDEDRYWLSGGLSYEPEDWFSLSLGYTHVFMPNADIDLSLEDPNNATRGSLEGTFKTHIDIIALQGRLRF